MEEIEALQRENANLAAELERIKQGYGKEMRDCEEQLALALGLTKDPDYGYPIGDHTITTLAMTVRGILDSLHRACNRADQMVERPYMTLDTDYIRRLIKREP